MPTKASQAIQHLMGTRSLKQARDVLWQTFEQSRCGKRSGTSLRILLLSTPCHGFGDLIFAKKIATYLRAWYGAKVTIASTAADQLQSLGEKKSNLVSLRFNKEKQCRRFKKLTLGKRIPRQDLIFVTPITTEYTVDLKDVRHLIDYASRTNTFFFSEYNDKRGKSDFPTGIGQDRMGMLFTTPPKLKRLRTLTNPYVMSYIADEGSIVRAKTCLFSFVEMVATKYYRKHRNLDVVVPKWMEEEDCIDYVERRMDALPYDGVEIYTKDEIITLSEGSRTLRLRCDILPVSYNQMISLFSHSLDDVLVTGDQSITDVLSCCASKNIFYQIADWKIGFANHLTRLLPNQYLAKKTTSCGTLKAIQYRSKYKKFVNEWDFRKNARSKLNGIVLAARAQQQNQVLQDLTADIDAARTLRALKRKYEE
tara:strand:- start:6208 stop:7476 length:1269 start_codon:yes stop_codon:yes gene_type:complete